MKTNKSFMLCLSLLTVLSSSCSVDDEVAEVFGEALGEVAESLEIQMQLDEGITPLELYKNGITLEDIFGRFYEGGMITYLDTLEGTGIVSSIDLVGTAEWGCPTIPSNATSTEIYAGESNTQLINSICEDEFIAANLCLKLELEEFDDWHLPSVGELNLIYQNLHNQGKALYPDEKYWSSTEVETESAFSHNFQDGNISIDNKSDNMNVIAIRYF